MELSDFGAALLLANAAVHLAAFLALRRVDATIREIVAFGAFVPINGLLGILVLAGVGWAEWMAIVFPAIGGLGLAATFSTSQAPRWTVYTVLALDAALVVIFGLVRL